MKHTNELERSLNENFGWNKARMSCFAKMLLALFAVCTVNLSKLAVAFSSDAKIESRYKRLQRFFAIFKIDMNQVAKFVFNLFFEDKEKVYLTIDRTNWFFGKFKINSLTLGIAHEGIAIPLLWNLLKTSGNAKGKEHVAIVKKFVKIFGKNCIAGVLADREFANQDFFRYLVKAEIPFYIRVKEGAKVRIFLEKTFKVKRLFNKLKQKSQMLYIQPVTIHGQKLFVAAGKSETGELLIVATNQYKAKNAVSIYLRRWEIEVLFQSLKSRGFNFEETHINKRERIEKLMVLLAIGFSWCHKIGEWRAMKKSIRLNKFKNTRRSQYSYFRYGLDWIRDIILHIYKKKWQFKQCLKQLFPPPKIPKNPILEPIS